MTADDLAKRFQVPRAVARLAISRRIVALCVELAERDSEPAKAFVAAVNVLAWPRRRHAAELPIFRSLAEMTARASPEQREAWSLQAVDEGRSTRERLIALELLAEAEGDFSPRH